MADDVFHFAPPDSDFNRWLNVARRAALGHYTRDAILGGLRARLFTDNLTLAETWADTFFGPQEWHILVRHTPPTQVTLSMYAAAVKDHAPVLAASPAQAAAVMINQTDGDALLDTLIALAAHKLVEQIAWVARGTCVAVGQRDVLVTGPGHAQVAEQLALHTNGRITLADPVLLRITLTRQVDGVQLAPTRILTERGQEITGARALHWLRRDAYQEPRADVFCLTLDQRDEPAMARDLDLDRYAELYAYPLTRTGRKSVAPPLITDAVLALSDSRVAVLSLDAKTFAARLAGDQPWISQAVVQEAASTLECHAAGVSSLDDQQFQLFIQEIAERLSKK